MSHVVTAQNQENRAGERPSPLPSPHPVPADAPAGAAFQPETSDA